MWVYVIILSYTLFLSLRFDKQKVKGKRFDNHYCFLAVIYVLLSGLAYQLGGDSFTFRNDFELLPDRGGDYNLYFFNAIQKGYMPLWILLNIVCKYLFGSFYAVQIIQSAFVNITAFYFIRKETVRPFFAVAIYAIFQYFNLNTEVMREAIAVAFGMWALDAYFRDKKGRFYLLTIIGVMFHISAIILFVFPLIRFRASIRAYVIAVIISFPLFYASNYLAGFLDNWSIFGYSEGMADKAASYVNTTVTIFGFGLKLIRRLIMPGIFFIYALREDANDCFNVKKNKLASFYLFLAVFGCSFAGFTRFLNYMSIYFVIFFCNFWFCSKRFSNSLVLIKTCVILLVLYSQIRSTYFNYYPTERRYSYEYWVPYTSIFNEDVNMSFRDDMHQEGLHSATDANKRK